MIPKVFLNYSWDDEKHKDWVEDLATKLKSDGINIRLDEWHIDPGDQLPEFMEKEIRENDFVLIICTPKYKSKSESRSGGVGYEGHLITSEFFKKKNHKKFIPILALGEWEDSSPSWAQGKFYIDMRVGSFEKGYKKLLDTLKKSNKKGVKEAPASSILIEQSENNSEENPMKITGFVPKEFTIPKNDGSRGSALYTVVLQLSKTPSRLWNELFVVAWDHPSSYTPMHRPGIARVSGSKIYLQGTTVEEVAKYHLKTLNLSVDTANNREKAELSRRSEQRKLEHQKIQSHEEEVHNVISKIHF